MVDWINISQNSGSGNATITVTATSYSQLLERSTALTVRTATKSAVVGITQRFNNDFVVSPTTISAIPYSGASYSITVTANDNWSATTIPAWCSLSVGSGNSGTTTITLTVDSNSGSARTDSIVFICNGLNRSVSVSQAAYEAEIVSISLSPSTISIPSSGGSYTVTVTCNGEWSLTAPAWLALSSSSGSGNTSITVTANANTGNTIGGTIYGVTTNNSSIVLVTQEGHYVGSDGYISPSALTFTDFGGTDTIYISSNVSWSLSVDSNFVTLSQYNGMSGTSIPVTVTVAQNNTSARTATITLKNGDASQTFDTTTVSQSAISYQHYSLQEENFLEVGCNGGHYTFDVSGITNPVLAGDYAGIHYKPNGNYEVWGTTDNFTARVENSTIYLDVPPNNGYYGRTVSVFDGIESLQAGLPVANIFCSVGCPPACTEDYTAKIEYTISSAEVNQPKLLFTGINPMFYSGWVKIDDVIVDLEWTTHHTVDRGLYTLCAYYTFNSTGNHTVEITILDVYSGGGNYAWLPSGITSLWLETTPRVVDSTFMLQYSGITPYYYALRQSDCAEGYGLGSVNIGDVTTVKNNAFMANPIGSTFTRIECPRAIAPTIEGELGLPDVSEAVGPPYGPAYEVHAPVGSDYSTWEAKLPAGWSLVYDL